MLDALKTLHGSSNGIYNSNSGNNGADAAMPLPIRHTRCWAFAEEKSSDREVRQLHPIVLAGDGRVNGSLAELPQVYCNELENLKLGGPTRLAPLL